MLCVSAALLLRWLLSISQTALPCDEWLQHSACDDCRASVIQLSTCDAWLQHSTCNDRRASVNQLSPVMRDCSTLPVMRDCSTLPVTVALRLWCMTIAAALLRWRITWAKRTLNQKNQILYPQNFIQKKGNYSGPTVVEQSTFSTPMGFITINIPKFATITDQSTVYILV